MKKAFLITFLAIVATTFVRYNDVVFDNLVMFLVFAIISYLLKFKNKIGHFYVPFFIFLIYTVVTLIEMSAKSQLSESRYISVGSINFLSGIIGSLIGAFINYSRPRFKIVGLLLFVSFLAIEIWYVQTGNKYWFNLMYEGSLTGKIEERLPSKWQVQNENLQRILSTDSPFKAKVVVLDFWFQSCGFCFAGFPHFATLANKYKTDSNFYFATINIPMESDPYKSSFALLREKDFSINAYVGNDSLAKFFNINKYPTLVIVSQDSILFTGNLELAADYLSSNYPCK
jgi:thiol-disulfide isomerase/thioredoxin